MTTIEDNKIEARRLYELKSTSIQVLAMLYDRSRSTIRRWLKPPKRRLSDKYRVERKVLELNGQQDMFK